MRRWITIGLFTCCLATLPGAEASPASSRSDTAPGPPAPGTLIAFEQSDELEPWIPEPLWEHRGQVFHPGMQMTIGPPDRDYSPAAVYQKATERHHGSASLGEDGSLLGFRSGQPFPVDEIACQADPDAGRKLIWNFVHRWQGFGAEASFRYTYLDRGEVLPLMYQGHTSAYILKHRPEPQFESTDGDVFEDESKLMVVGFDVEKPPQAAGTRTLTYRYASSFGPLATARPEDTWLYARTVRRVRKISQAQRSNAVAGTDFTFDDLFTFSGLPPQYEWTCVETDRVLAPMNTMRLGFPYDPDASYGPSGLSFATDRWELRDAFRLRMKPKDPDHPYSRKELWIDRQTMQPLYSFAYDNKGELWKIIYHNHRWSEDDIGDVTAREWYPGWEGVPEPRDLRVVSDAIINVQTSTGNRLDFWDSHGTAPDLKALRQFMNVQRLRRGR